MHKIGLILSGGGARGLAHIGVLKVLEEYALIPDLITGTSMGGIIGGLYSYGLTIDEMKSFLKNFKIKDLFEKGNPLALLFSESEESKILKYIKMEIAINFLLTRTGLDSGRKIRAFLGQLTKHTDFSNLKIPFACVAADIITGEKAILKEGRLSEAMYATMAIPPFFEPFKYGDKLLVDGGILSNAPVDIAKEMGATKIITIDVNNSFKNKQKKVFRSAFEILFRVFDIENNIIYNKELLKSDLLISIELEAEIFDFKKYKHIIKKGEEATYNNLSELKKIWER